jgi:hypothetical protein
MKKKILISAGVALLLVVIAGAVMPLATAGIGSITPINDLNGVAFETESPQAFSMINEDREYLRLLMYLEDEHGEFSQIETYGYYYQNREKTKVCYSIWIPDSVPTGKYNLHIDVSRRAWIAIEYCYSDGTTGWYEGYYGPWTNLFPLDYEIVVLNSGDVYYNSFDSDAITSTPFGIEDADISFGNVGEAEDYLTEGQLKVLRTTIKDEAEQRGV